MELSGELGDAFRWDVFAEKEGPVRLSISAVGYRLARESPINALLSLAQRQITFRSFQCQPQTSVLDGRLCILATPRVLTTLQNARARRFGVSNLLVVGSPLHVSSILAQPNTKLPHLTRTMDVSMRYTNCPAEETE